MSVETELPPLRKRQVSPLLVAYRQIVQQAYVGQHSLQKMMIDSNPRKGEFFFDTLLGSLPEIGLVTRQIRRFAQLIEHQGDPTISFPNHPLWLTCPLRLAE